LKDSHRTLEEDLNGLIREADQALYLAKNNGGDQNVMLELSSS
jgi:PleD family two-component response regulator